MAEVLGVLLVVAVFAVSCDLSRIARSLRRIDVELQLRRADRDNEQSARLLIRNHTEAIRNQLERGTGPVPPDTWLRYPDERNEKP